MSGPRVSGPWVTERLGVRLDGPAGTDGLTVHDVLGLALRRNPRRAHLLVSQVLGKHVPTDPRLVRAAGLRLGERAATALGVPDAPGAAAGVWRAALAGDGPACAAVLAGVVRPPVRPDALVLGYAETATGLGHAVADALGAACLHSTRREVPGALDYAGFLEEHSHATGHQLLPADPDVLARLADPTAPLVLVDDELSTGRTVANTLGELHSRTAREHYVVAGLVDVRSPADRARLTDLARELGTRIDVVSLVEGSVHLPEGVLGAGAALTAAVDPALPQEADVPDDVERVTVDWPAGVPVTARFGTSGAHAELLAGAVPTVAAPLVAALRGADDVLVLGSEELLHAPLLLACALAQQLDADVRFSSTTRSPVLAVDDPGYAVRSSLAFTSHDPAQDGPGVRYAHNVSRPDGRPWSAVVLVVDSASDPAALAAPTGVLAALRPHTGRLLLLTLPADSWSTAP